MVPHHADRLGRRRGSCKLLSGARRETLKGRHQELHQLQHVFLHLVSVE